MGALFSVPGWEVETGARLASLFFSSLVFFALLGIGKQCGFSPLAVASGLFILAIAPVLISLSISILSEPTYIGLIYGGFWLFWIQYKELRLGIAALLGLTFGFAFVTRTEGILYLAIIPFLQGIHTLFVEKHARSFKPYIAWSLIYVLCFSAIAAPQIWRVSHKMGKIALNGRQAWVAVLDAPGDKPYREKLSGLDYSPGEINIVYLRTHPEEWPETKPQNLFGRFKQSISNFHSFYQRDIGILLGPLCFLAFGLGLLALYQSGRRFETFLVIAFIGANLIGPLLLAPKYWFKHSWIIAPVMCVVAGLGVVYASRILMECHKKSQPVHYLALGSFLVAIIFAWAVPLKSALKPPDYNEEYSLMELREPLRILQEIAENEGGRVPMVLAERSYINFFLGTPRLEFPYTDYQGLLKYCELNNVEFLYLVHRRLRKWETPFFEEFTNNNTQVSNNFSLLYSGVDAYGEKVELYRIVNYEP
jgi:4-amino-4-deoxy-L-arabinose transferase-like glycosyltransferase